MVTERCNSRQDFLRRALFATLTQTQLCSVFLVTADINEKYLFHTHLQVTCLQTERLNHHGRSTGCSLKNLQLLTLSRNLPLLSNLKA
jgi:hypothetical protein